VCINAFEEIIVSLSLFTVFSDCLPAKSYTKIVGEFYDILKGMIFRCEENPLHFVCYLLLTFSFYYDHIDVIDNIIMGA